MVTMLRICSLMMTQVMLVQGKVGLNKFAFDSERVVRMRRYDGCEYSTG